MHRRHRRNTYFQSVPVIAFMSNQTFASVSGTQSPGKSRWGPQFGSLEDTLIKRDLHRVATKAGRVPWAIPVPWCSYWGQAITNPWAWRVRKRGISRSGKSEQVWGTGKSLCWGTGLARGYSTKGRWRRDHNHLGLTLPFLHEPEQVPTGKTWRSEDSKGKSSWLLLP